MTHLLTLRGPRTEALTVLRRTAWRGLEEYARHGGELASFRSLADGRVLCVLLRRRGPP